MTDRTQDALDRDAGAKDAAAKESPRVKPLRRRTLIALAVLCILNLAAHLVILPHMPEMVPSHWDMAGNINGWTTRATMPALDALPLLILIACYFVPNFDPRRQAYARMGDFYAGFITVLTLFMVGITWIPELTVFDILPKEGGAVGAIVTVLIGVGFVLLGNYMPKIKRNYTFGCKTPWALDNDQNWRLTHRFGGTAFVAGGVVTIASGVISLYYGNLAFDAFTIAIIGSTVATILYSYLVFRNGNKPLHAR